MIVTDVVLNQIIKDMMQSDAEMKRAETSQKNHDSFEEFISILRSINLMNQITEPKGKCTAECKKAEEKPKEKASKAVKSHYEIIVKFIDGGQETFIADEYDIEDEIFYIYLRGNDTDYTMRKPSEMIFPISSVVCVKVNTVYK